MAILSCPTPLILLLPHPISVFDLHSDHIAPDAHSDTRSPDTCTIPTHAGQAAEGCPDLFVHLL